MIIQILDWIGFAWFMIQFAAIINMDLQERRERSK